MQTIHKRTPRNEIRRLQAHVWPHIMHEFSAILIGNHGSGKTSTIIPAICSLLTRLYEDDELPETSGPAVIIVTAFADNVTEIARNVVHHTSIWNERQEERKRIIVEEAYGRHREAEIEAKMLGGLGVLVTTLSCLKRIIDRTVNDRISLLTKSRLKIFVVEDFDTVFNHYGMMICDQIQHFYVKHTNGNLTQLIITSTQWETQLQKYCQFGKNPTLYIANYIEATVYGRAKFRLSLSTKQNKLFLVQKFLAEGIYKEKRTLIICSNDDEVNDVCGYLKDLHIICTSYTHDTDEAGREHALSWHEDTNKHFSVLVCSDVVLGDLSKVKNVQRLFHFSLPDMWSTFSFRFSVFFDTYHDFLKNSKPPENYEAPSTQILIDESAENTLPRLTNFLKRINAKIPPEIEEITRKILTEREIERKSTDLCPYFLEYGIEASICPRINCRGRHTLLPCDKPTERMPPHGAFLKVNITCMHSPIHYSGQVLAFRFHNENKWNNFENKDQNFADFELQMQLNLYLNNFTNQTQHFPVNKGDICAWNEPSSSNWRRVQVIQVSKVSSDRPQRASIRLIDTGAIYYDKSITSLFSLSETLRNIPARAIDIHYVGLIPYDGDMFWGGRANNCVKYHLEKFLNHKMNGNTEMRNNFYIKANVAFRIENNIWTKSLVFCEPLVNNHITELPVHKVLIRNHFAERDENLKQLDVLKQMAEELGNSF